MRRVSMVAAIEMPIEPPMFRSRLKMPVALPICSLVTVRVAMLPMGTKRKLSANPVTMMGMSMVRGPIPVLMLANQMEQRPKITKPQVSSQRLSTLRVMKPTIGKPIMEPMPRGATTRPAVSAV